MKARSLTINAVRWAVKSTSPGRTSGDYVRRAQGNISQSSEKVIEVNRFKMCDLQGNKIFRAVTCEADSAPIKYFRAWVV